MTTIPIISEPEFLSGTTYMEKLRKFFAALPHRIYKDSNEEKVQISLGLLHDQEMIGGMRNVVAAIIEATGSDAGISVNGIYLEPSINIPVRVIDQLDEKSAKALVKALIPLISLAVTTKNSRLFLSETMGLDKVFVRRILHENTFCYMFTLPYKRTFLDAIRPNVAHQFNAALQEPGQPLFQSVYMDDGKHEKVWIKEKDINRLYANPNHSKLSEILIARVKESGSYDNAIKELCSHLQQRLLPRRDQKPV